MYAHYYKRGTGYFHRSTVTLRITGSLPGGIAFILSYRVAFTGRMAAIPAASGRIEVEWELPDPKLIPKLLPELPPSLLDNPEPLRFPSCFQSNLNGF